MRQYDHLPVRLVGLDSGDGVVEPGKVRSVVRVMLQYAAVPDAVLFVDVLERRGDFVLVRGGNVRPERAT